MNLLSPEKIRGILGEYKYDKNFKMGACGRGYKSFYIGDFSEAQDEKIRDFLFEYDKNTDTFVLPANRDVAYRACDVLIDSDFLIFEL